MTTEPITAGTSPDRDVVTLDIEGMTCASCAMRIEKRLNRLEGVTATVNYATEKATVAVPSDVATDDLVAQVEAAGYTARTPQPPASGPGRDVGRLAVPPGGLGEPAPRGSHDGHAHLARCAGRLRVVALRPVPRRRRRPDPPPRLLADPGT